jgi:YD repeat-containing protein
LTRNASTFPVTRNPGFANRIIKVTRPGGATVVTDYNKSATRVQDEGKGTGNKITKIYRNDSLGRLLSVCEVTSVAQLGTSGTPADCGLDTAGTGFLTSYSYDSVDDLLSVTQTGINNRTYVYDMLSRLTSETTPESGNVTYSYDTLTAGDLYQRIGPKPNQTSASVKVTTTYSFDVLHRPTGRSYNDGVTSAVSLTYDQTSVSGVSPQNPKGRLTQAGVSSANTIIGYDPNGRIADEWQCTPLNCGSGSFHLHYGYDLRGEPKSLVNDTEGLTYSYTYDTMARLLTMKSSLNDANHPGTLFTVNQYNSLGLIQQATLGNGIVRNLQYDNRGRVTSLTDGSIYNFSLTLAPDSNVKTGFPQGEPNRQGLGRAHFPERGLVCGEDLL